MPEDDQLLNFPCSFSIKAIGEGDEYFPFVVQTLMDLTGGIDLEIVSVRQSAGEKYISVTVPFVAESREQLEEIYRRLSEDSRTRFLL